MGMTAQRKRPGSKVDRKSTRLNSSHLVISYAVFCLKKHSFVPEDSIEVVATFPGQEYRDKEGDQVTACLSQAKAGNDKDFQVFFFKVPATTEISTLTLQDALPI